jgi:hypothetical protein
LKDRGLHIGNPSFCEMRKLSPNDGLEHPAL